MKKFSSPKQLKDLYILTNNPLEKARYIKWISDRLEQIRICLENGSLVRK